MVKETKKPFGGTSLYDALVRASSMFAKRKHQRAGLVIISDGEDTASDAKRQDALWALTPTGAFVYALAIDAPTGPAINRGFSPHALQEITGQNGGYTAVITRSDALAESTERISTELNHQYTVGFVSPYGHDGKYHLLRVRMQDATRTACARRGYFATPR